MKIDSQSETIFSIDEALEQLSKVLDGWWDKNNRSGFALYDDEIDLLYKTRIQSHKVLEQKFHQILQTSKERRKNLAILSDLKIVSIGEDCLPRTVLTRWGLKIPARMGQKSGPFDLAVHPTRVTEKLLCSNFDRYLNTDDLEYDNLKKICRNTHYGVSFNHEVGEEYAENGFHKLKTTYQKRLENFRSVLAEPEKKIFVSHIQTPSKASWKSIVSIRDKLEEFCGKNIASLVCLNTWKTDEQINNDFIAALDDNGIHQVNLKYPRKGYVWHQHAHTQMGYQFEKELICNFKQIVFS